METFAWTGLWAAVLLIALRLLGGIVGMVFNPVGRALILGWIIVGIVAWGAFSAIYLIAQAV